MLPALNVLHLYLIVCTLRDHLLEPYILNSIVDDLETQRLHQWLHSLLLKFCLVLLRDKGSPLCSNLLKFGLKVSHNEVYGCGVVTPEWYNDVRIAHGWLYVLIIGGLDEAIVLIEDTFDRPSSLTAISEY